MESRKRGTTHYCPSCKAAVDRVDTVCLNCEASRPPTGWPVDPYVGRVLGKKYRIDRRFSVGGFGMVFLATQVHQGEDLGRVIIKMLHPEHAFDPVITKRFINEVKAARAIVNPHMVKIFDVDFDQGNVPYMVQEFVEGRGLAEVLEHEISLPVSRAVAIALQVAEGMDEAHQQDIIHRDLKPENILLQRGKRVDFAKIIDFGIARVSNPDGMVTTSFVGTPRYMPPEQIRGKKLDGRADIFALGVILFEMIAGRPPIRVEDSDLEYLTLNCSQPPERLLDLEPEIPPALDALVDGMMAKDPAARPSSMREVAEELSAIAADAGYSMEFSGEWTVPDDARTRVDSTEDATARDLISTPVSGDYAAQIPAATPSRPGLKSDSFTQERPASGQHERPGGRSLGLPAVALLAGLGAFALVLASAVVVVVLITFRGDDDAVPAHGKGAAAPPEGGAPAEPPHLAAGAGAQAAADADSGGDAGEKQTEASATDEADGPVEEPEEAPSTVTAKPPGPGGEEVVAPPKKPKPKKKKKRRKKAEGSGEDSPWTKL